MTNSIPPVASISDVRQFKQCRQAWHFNSAFSMNLRPKSTPVYFSKGQAVHKAMELFFSNFFGWATYEQATQAMFVEAVRIFDKILADEYRELGHTDDEIEGLLNNEDHAAIVSWFWWTFAELPRWFHEYSGLQIDRVLHTENQYKTLVNGVNFGWTCDLIVELEDGKVIIIDFKTTQSMPTESDYLLLDEQATTYAALTNSKYPHYNITDIVFIYINTTPYGNLKRLKNGMFSTAQRQRLTYSKVQSSLIDEGEQDNPKYKGFADRFKDCSHMFYKAHTTRTLKHQENYLVGLRQVLREMVQNPDIYPTATRMGCSRCSFFDPCRQILEGNPKRCQVMLKNDYVTRKPRYV